MLVTKPLDSAQVQQMEQQLQPDNPSRLIAQASNMLSELTQFAGVVATAKRNSITVRQIEFLRLGEKRVLLIIVMPDGEVENRVLLMERDYTQSQLTEAGNFLNQNYIGCSFSQIRDRLRGELQQLHQDMSALMTAALAAGDAAQAKKAEDYVISGEHNLLHVEDLSADMNRLRRTVQPVREENRTAAIARCQPQGARHPHLCRQRIRACLAGRMQRHHRAVFRRRQSSRRARRRRPEAHELRACDPDRGYHRQAAEQCACRNTEATNQYDF